MEMANRVPIDLEGLRERVENARSDPAWKELSLSKKVRILLQERLEEVERIRQKDILAASAKRREPEPQTIAELIEQNYSKLIELGGVEPERLEALKNGEKPTIRELVFLARDLDMDEELIVELRDRRFPKKK